jgi:hypothetical protein
MATLTTQQVTSSGLNPTANVAAEAGDKVRPGSIAEFINGSVGSITVTMVTPVTYDGDLSITDRAVAVPAGESRFVAATEKYRSKTDQLVTFTYSAFADLTVKVIKA